MQNELDVLYKEVLDKEKIKELFKDKVDELEKISAPHLLNIDINYMNANRKILYVGKETNLWWGKLKHYIEINNSQDFLKQRYRAKFYGGDVPMSKNIFELKHYNKKSHKTPFWSTYNKFNNALCEDKIGALCWLNLLKMDMDIGRGYSRNSKSNPDIVSLSKKIFLKEIDILKPNYIIFVTGYKYDKIIKEFFEDKITQSEVIEPRSLWKFNIGDTVCFRTWHPSTIKYRAEKTKDEYCDDIINLIRSRDYETV